MEQKNRENIIKIDSDLQHIKKDVGDIKSSIAIFIQASQKAEKDIVDLRGRVRELEHESIENKTGLKEVKGLLWKLFVALGAGGTGAVGLWEVLGK